MSPDPGFEGGNQMTKKLVGSLLYLFVYLFILGLSAASARNLLIQGGTLIDGTGKAPVQNVRILVEGNTIRRIWTGDANAPSLPPDTQVVNAQGKFIIPGLIDSHVHYREYMGELFLAYGVTAVYDLGNPVYWQAAIKKGLNEGKIHGPRFYFCGGITLPGASGGGEPTVRARDFAEMKSLDDAKRAVAVVREKTDCLKLSESVNAGTFTVLAREARAAGMGVISHSLNVTDSASWGITGVEHMVGVAISTIRAPEGRRALAGMNIEAGHKNSLLYQWMEPAYFQEVIDSLVSRQVMINPTLHFEWKALTEHAPEHELEDTRLLANPRLQYVPLSERMVSLGQYHWADGRSSADREQFLKGYRRVQEFLSRFVKAGGKIYSGTDSAAATTPGLSLHHEMELLVDAGLTPMDALRTSTQWAAEIIGLQRQLGTVEAGKLADLVILRSNPLDDIRRAKEVDTVIRDGEIMDTGFHGDYSFPFRRRGPESKHLYNPIPVLSDVNPPVAPQGAEVRLRILGRGFVPSSVVVMDGEGLPTAWVSPTELTAVLPSARSARVGTLLIQVETPLPGGGITEPIEFFITYP
jgi:hypothetical protein